jgi:DnaJ-class molecular chaperone
MPGAYTCPTCSGTGKSPVQLGPTNGFLSAPVSDRPVCARCGGTGRVSELVPRDRDALDVVLTIVRRVSHRLSGR